MRTFLDDFESTSKATVISVCPFPIKEYKTGLMPSEFLIPAAPFGEVATLVLDDAFFFVYIDESRGHIRSITPSLRLARSIVEDYCQAQLSRAPGAEPGLFSVQGAYSPKEALAKFQAEITEARARHKNWCERLVAIADDSWNANQKRASVSERSRDAAKFLGLTDRPWLSVAPAVAAEVVQYKSCPVCFENVHPQAIVCRSCKAVLDKEKYEKINKAA